MTADGLTWGYAPYRADLSAPGDRRRFGFWADRRGTPFRVLQRDSDVDIAVLSARADISYWTRLPKGRTRLVYDIVDSYLDAPRLSPRSLLRGAAKFAAGENQRPLLDYHRAILEMCRRADAVVCATEEQRQAIRQLNDNVHVILDSHGELGDRAKVDYRRRDDQHLHVVWEGLPENVEQFEVIAEVLADLTSELGIHVHLVTALEYRKYVGRFVRRSTVAEARRLLPQCRLYEWHVRTLPAIAAACDLAVIPLDVSDPFARGKPANKLLSFWRMGLPTLVSETPAYRQTMAAAGVDGCCATPDDWRRQLRLLAGDEDARRAAADAGHRYVHEEHTDDRLLGRWDAVFRSLGLDVSP